MAETVSKTKGGVATSEVPTPAEPVETTQPIAIVETPRKTVTNWRVFEKGGFIPVRVKCEGYKNNHPADLSCKTTIIPNGENVTRHMDSAHGGGWFKIKFRISDSGKVHPIWRELEDAGVEITDLFCPHCEQNVDMTPRRIVYHLQNHPGARRTNLEPQVLCFSLGFGMPEQSEIESLFTE